MKFGKKVRSLRQAKGLSQRALAPMLGIDFTYLSKFKNERLGCAAFPSEGLICKIARVLGACEDELLLLTRKIPPAIRRRALERPDAFRRQARLDEGRFRGGETGRCIRWRRASWCNRGCSQNQDTS